MDISKFDSNGEVKISKINCDIHGKGAYTMELLLDGITIGLYCFKCYDDFLKKHLKDYKAGDNTHSHHEVIKCEHKDDITKCEICFSPKPSSIKHFHPNGSRYSVGEIEHPDEKEKNI